MESLICGSLEDVTGDVCAAIALLYFASPCNIYGGGNNVSVGGDIFFDFDGGRSTGTIYGGTRANGEAASVGDVNITLKDTNCSGNIYGGGYAYNGGVSTVESVSMTFDGSEGGVIYVVGTVYGGGANPCRAGYGGSSEIIGDAVITLTGYAENFLMSTINGDGKVTGAVQGESRLVLENLTGELAVNIVNFDTIEFVGSTDVVISGGSASHLAFPTVRWDSSYPCATLDEFTFCGDGELDICMTDCGATQQFIYCDDTSIFDDVAVNFWDEDDLIATVCIGDEFYYNYKYTTYQVAINDYGLGLNVEPR